MTHLSFKNPNKILLFAVLVILSAIASIIFFQFFGLFETKTPQAAGDTTVINRTSTAYEQPSKGLNQANFDKHGDGDIAFEAVFVTAPARVNPGLGPLFNNASCAGCHIRNGRGLPEKGQLLVRVSSETKLPDVDLPVSHPEELAPGENTPPVPGLGTQIQDQGIYKHQPEAEVILNWAQTTGTYADGTDYELQYHVPKIILANGEPLPETVQTSLRIPSPVFGLGLLEAVPEKTIRDLADPEDRNGDGISGKTNEVWDVAKKATVLGRFGWKANNPNLLQQSAAAYVNDMGVTNPLFPEPDGTSDIDAETLENAEFYVQTLAVPARTLLNDPQVQRGEVLFNESKCSSCHTETLKTGKYPVSELANQTIHPYTDLLLHDMGEGLADNRPDFLATGTEWRTAPLWGIGLTQTVLPYSSYLHDGRARTIEEAILWHGGEAKVSSEAFKNMEKSDRDSLVRFIHSL